MAEDYGTVLALLAGDEGSLQPGRSPSSMGILAPGSLSVAPPARGKGLTAPLPVAGAGSAPASATADETELVRYKAMVAAAVAKSRAAEEAQAHLEVRPRGVLRVWSAWGETMRCLWCRRR